MPKEVSWTCTRDPCRHYSFLVCCIPSPVIGTLPEILAFGFSGQFRSRTAIEALADAGANRVTIWLDQTAGDAALAEMDQMARQVLV